MRTDPDPLFLCFFNALSHCYNSIREKLGTYVIMAPAFERVHMVQCHQVGTLSMIKQYINIAFIK